MFTGLIEQVGEVESVRQTDAGRELRIAAPFTDLQNGESIAINGACLTVREFGAGALSPFDGIPGDFRESLSKRPIVRTASFGEDMMSVYALH